MLRACRVCQMRYEAATRLLRGSDEETAPVEFSHICSSTVFSSLFNGPFCDQLSWNVRERSSPNFPNDKPMCEDDCHDIPF